jgi:hypothetical protein
VIRKDFGDEVLVSWLRRNKGDRRVPKQQLHRGVATFLGLMSLEDGKRGAWLRDPSK